MPTLEVILPSLHEGQRNVIGSDARFKTLACGRRWGKTRLGCVLCVKTGLERKRAWWIAPSYPVAAVGWREIKRLSLQIPGTVVREVDKMILFPGGGWLQVRSADNPDSLRGEGLDFAVIDECAFVQEAAWNEALRPALSDRKGRALFISTPKGRNWFYHAWIRGQANDPDWQSWRFPTEANPFIDPAEIEAAKRALPERIFAQEYMAVFLEDAGGVFRKVTDAARAVAQEHRLPEHEYCMGVDLARRMDFTVCSVIDRSLPVPENVYMDRFNEIDWQFQVGRIKATAERFGVSAVIVDQTGVGDPIVEQLQRDLPGIVAGYQFTNATKAVAVESLALAFEQETLRILPDPVLINELQAYEMERLPSGLIRYNAVPGAHDDCVMALALAWQGASEALAFGSSYDPEPTRQTRAFGGEAWPFGISYARNH